MSSNIKIDKTSGSMAFNRFEMQISQAVLLTIDLYTNLDFLLVMDYYDDITLFDDSKNPNSVSYYQMKTSEDSFTFNAILSNDWISKLYEHLFDNEYLINELALITNCPIKENEKPKKIYREEKTSFTSFNANTIKKIKEDISKKFNVSENEVDLSNFFHICTNLTINKHQELAENELANFLNQRYRKITYDSIKTIYKSLVMLLTKKQKYEKLGEKETFETVRKYKGVSKGDIESIIKHTLLINIPPFEILDRALQFDEKEKPYAALEHSRILADSNAKSDEFYKIVEKVDYLTQKNPIAENESFPNYVNKITELLPFNPLFNKLYLNLLITCIYINKQE